MKQVPSRALKIEAVYFSQMSVDFNGLHGFIFQKINLFITTAVRASDPTYTYLRSDKNEIRKVAWSLRNAVVNGSD
jgi:hypothetical protein